MIIKCVLIIKPPYSPLFGVTLQLFLTLFFGVTLIFYRSTRHLLFHWPHFSLSAHTRTRVRNSARSIVVQKYDYSWWIFSHTPSCCWLRYPLSCLNVHTQGVTPLRYHLLSVHTPGVPQRGAGVLPYVSCTESIPTPPNTFKTRTREE